MLPEDVCVSYMQILHHLYKNGTDFLIQGGLGTKPPQWWAMTVVLTIILGSHNFYGPHFPDKLSTEVEQPAQGHTEAEPGIWPQSQGS